METIKLIQSISNPLLDNFFLIITNLGGQTLGILLALYFMWCYNTKKAYKLLFGLTFSLCINNLIKIFVNSKRPIGTEGIRSLAIKSATGTSFPSGHSQGTSTTFTLIMMEYKTPMIYAFSIFMIIIVPISRLYLGVHWPIDVVCGVIFGIICAIISSIIFEYGEKINSVIPFCIVSIIFIAISFFYSSNDFIKALGGITAINIGYILDKKYIRFNPISNKRCNIIKFLIGLPGAVILFLLIHTLVPDGYLNAFLKYFILGIWGTVIAPLIFIKLNLSSKKYIW